MSIEVESVVTKQWRPNKGKQDLFLSLPDSIFEQFYGGAAGGGKSEALMMRPILRQWTDNNRFQAIILRRTYKELEESLIERSKRGGINKDGTEIPSFSDFGAVYNEQKKKWRFPSGATITFGHAEEEADIRKYDTAEYQYCAFDELTSFTEFQYKFMAFSRVRSIIPGIPALVCSASNPGNIGHRWVRERFVEPCKTGSKIIAERVKIHDAQGNVIEEKLIKRIFIQAFLSDNPRLMENDPMYRVRMEMLPEADRRAKAQGDWWTFSGQVFAEWRAERFPDEPENAIHVVSPYTPDLRLPRVLAIDWGYRAMNIALFGVPLPKKRAYIYKEMTTENESGEIESQSVKVWASQLANECLLEGINPYIVLDPSAWQERGTGTIADQFIDAWKKVVGRNPRLEKAFNDRISGKMLIHDYLRWKKIPRLPKEIQGEYNPETANWIYRNKGIDAHKAYLAQFIPQSDVLDEDLPRLLISSLCKVLIRTIPLCVYDEKKLDKKVEDVKEFSGDDPYDDLRYFLKKIDTMKVEDFQDINLQNGQVIDYNRIHRLAELAEKKKRETKYIVFGRRRGIR